MSLEDVESEVIEATSGTWARRVALLRSALLALWSARGEALTGEDVRAVLSRLELPSDRLDVDAMLAEASIIGDARVAGGTAVHFSAAATAALRSVGEKPTAALLEAERRAMVAPATLAGLLAVVGPLSKSVADMEAASAWAVWTAANEATVSAARQLGAKLVFVPERDACLRCIPLGGTTDAEAGFQVPPIHPRCRCEVAPYDDPAVPRALRRESIRSVLRGFSLPSESEAARVRAAAAMLQRRPNAPASVLAYARRAVERGKFPRGRRTP